MAQPMFPMDTPMTRRTLMESCAAVLLASAASARRAGPARRSPSSSTICRT